MWGTRWRSRALSVTDEARRRRRKIRSDTQRRWRRPSPLSSLTTSPHTVGSHQASVAPIFFLVEWVRIKPQLQYWVFIRDLTCEYSIFYFYIKLCNPLWHFQFAT